MKRQALLKRAFASAVVLSAVGSPLAGWQVQEPAVILDVRSRSSTRAELEAMMQPLQQRALTTEDSDARERAENDLEWLSYRLREGDIWQGDVIALAVAGEVDWTENFIVSPDRALLLPDIDPIPVGNLLYSELEEYLTDHLRRYLQQPQVQAEALKRIAVLGGVRSPGFFSVSGAEIISDVIMTAGGPSNRAEMDRLEFRRMGRKIGFDAGPIAFQAYSLDQLGIMSGDELYLPESDPGGSGFFRTFVYVIGPITGLIFTLTRIF